MKNGDNAVRLHWRRFIVDVLVGASTVVVSFAVIGAITDAAPYALLIASASALIGIGLLIEPNGTAQPDMQTTSRLDAPILDAAGA
jgi:hypothetical protein